MGFLVLMGYNTDLSGIAQGGDGYFFPMGGQGPNLSTGVRMLINKQVRIHRFSAKVTQNNVNNATEVGLYDGLHTGPTVTFSAGETGTLHAVDDSPNTYTPTYGFEVYINVGAGDTGDTVTLDSWGALVELVDW